MSGLSRRRNDSGQRERGAVMIEFALVVPLFVLLIAGTFDLGAAWKVGLVANSSARAGARVGSSAGPDQQADYLILSAMRSDLQSSGALTKLQRVIIYKSDASNGKVPTACLTGSPGSAKCNVITGAQLTAMTSASFNATTGCYSGSATTNWCPNARNNVQLTADYIGVLVEIRQPYMFAKVLGSGVTIRRNAVMRLEPKESS